MHRLQETAAPQARGLLCVLFLRLCEMPADSAATVLLNLLINPDAQHL